jgi:hypothetical protein
LAGQKAAEVLQNVNVPVVDHDVCNQKFDRLPMATKHRQFPEGIIDSIMCAGSEKKDACKVKIESFQFV